MRILPFALLHRSPSTWPQLRREREPRRAAWSLHRSIFALVLAAALVGALPAPGAWAQSAPAPSGGLEYVDQIGGATRAVAVWGDLWVVGQGPRVLVVRIEDGRAPVVMARSEFLGGIVDELVVGNGYAIAALRGHGLAVLGLADPRAPRLLSRLPDAGRYIERPQGGGMAVIDGGRLAVVGTWPGAIQPIDMSDPSRPRMLRPEPVDGPMLGLVTDGERVFVGIAQECDPDTGRCLVYVRSYEPGEDGSGLTLHQVKRTGAGRVISRIVAAGGGHLAFVNIGSRLEVWNLAEDTHALTSGGRYSIAPTSVAVLDASGIYVAEFASPGIRHYGPGSFHNAWLEREPIPMPSHARGHHMVRNGNRLVVAGGGAGLLGWEIGQGPARGILHMDNGLGYVHDVALGGRLAILAGQRGWSVIDTLAPDSLRQVAHHPTDEAVSAVAAWGSRFAVAKKHVRRLGESSNPVPPVDVAQLAFLEADLSGTVRSVRTVERDFAGMPLDVEIEGNRAVVPVAQGMVLEADLWPQPELTGKQAFKLPLIDVALQGERVLATYADRDGQMGIRAYGFGSQREWQADKGIALPISVASPALRLGRTSRASPRPAVDADGRLAVFVDGLDLYTIGLGGDAEPEILGTVDLPPAVSLLPITRGMATRDTTDRVPGSELFDNEVDVALAGRRTAWVAHGDSGVIGVDVSVPNFPSVFAAHDTPGDARRLVVAGDRIWVADGEGGLLVLRRTDGVTVGRAWLPFVGLGR